MSIFSRLLYSGENEFVLQILVGFADHICGGTRNTRNINEKRLIYNAEENIIYGNIASALKNA